MNNNKLIKPLQLAFIGGSMQSAVGYTHYIASQMDHRWQLVAGCFSTNSEINRQTGAQWGVAPERIYDQWQDLLEKEQGRIDAVVVLTPTPSHCEIVISALEQGHAVICEKALATSTDEVTAIKAKLEETRGFLAVTFNYSGYPMVRELRHKILSGEFGRLLHVQLEMPQEGFIRLGPRGEKPKPQAWRLQDGDIPVIYLDLGVHLHHLMYYLTGKSPLKVSADQASHGWFKDIVDNVSCLLRYSDGLQCQMWYSKSALGHRNGLRLRVYGEQASAEWYQAEPEELILNRVDGSRLILDRASPVDIANQSRYERFKAGHPAGFIEAFGNLYGDIANSLIQFQQTGNMSSAHVFGIDHAAEGIWLMDAIARSVRTEAWVSVTAEPSNQS